MSGNFRQITRDKSRPGKNGYDDWQEGVKSPPMEFSSMKRK